jgi:hypothetical protein
VCVWKICIALSLDQDRFLIFQIFSIRFRKEPIHQAKSRLKIAQPFGAASDASIVSKAIHQGRKTAIGRAGVPAEHGKLWISAESRYAALQ